MIPGWCFARAWVAAAVIVGWLPAVFAGNLVDEEKQIYVTQALITEPAWLQTSASLNSSLFDLPNAQSRPNAQVGFVFTPRFTWSIFDLLELQFALPLVINPDASGDRELDAAQLASQTEPGYVHPANWDTDPDFDLPGVQIGLKGRILGKKPQDGLFLAAGVLSHIPIERWATNFLPPKTLPNHSSSFRINPYLTMAYALGKFSPQLQVGVSLRLKEDVYDPDSNQIMRKGFTDLFFNLALPYALANEGTVPMIEINGTYNPDEGTQLFITPAVTFLPARSPATLGFACMIPVHDSTFREHEGFRFMVHFGYQIDALGIPGWKDADELSENAAETPPAGW